MKIRIGYLVVIITLLSCRQKNEGDITATLIPIAGTWQLVTGTVIDKGDTAVTQYTNNISFIKIINNTHFAFLQHDLSKGKGDDSVFVAGGGHYSLVDSVYTEHLEYCSDRAWEGNDFNFIVVIRNDTLIQRGVEKVDGAGVNRINIEKYIRMKNYSK